MTQFIFEGRDKTNRTGHEKIAIRNIRNAINWIVGGYYNSLQDGCLECVPDTFYSLAEEVYYSAMDDLYTPGCVFYGQAPKEIRFAGEKFCRAYIDWKLREDGDVQELATVKGWEL